MPIRRKLENIALALPIFGAAIILPPIVRVFAPDARIFGSPIIVVYLFSAWMGLILATFWLSRKLKPKPTEEHASNDLHADNQDALP